ncbi:aldehyde dehydrogenase family 16 member A1 isoform X3 [Agelaius phoeniceus]|uniref:aldehyde dehydrogenase family 16 member A1 isoform X3 n=1 Tax=Agelaius phoeniceus TaxID=39638 RepID=UPI0040550772
MAALAALGAPPVPEIFATMEEGPIPGRSNPGEAWLESHGRSLGHFVNGTWLRPEGRESLECHEATTGRTVATVPAGDSSDVAVAVAAAAAAAEAWAGLGGPQRGQHLARGGGPGPGGSLLAAGAALETGATPGHGERGRARGPPGGGAAAAAAGGAGRGGGGAAPGGPERPGGTPGTAPGPARPPRDQSGHLDGGGGAGRSPVPPLGVPVPCPLSPVPVPMSCPHVPLPVPMSCPCPCCCPHELSPCPCVPHPQDDLRCHLWGSPLRGPRLGGCPRGGRVVVIVLDSADLDSAAAAAATLPRGGCVLLAQDSVAAPLEQRLRARLGQLRLGDPTDPRTEVGPLPPETPLPEELLWEAREEGAQVFQVPLPPLPGRGQRFYPPTLISGVAPTSRCLREPVPGPVLVLLPVRGPSEAVAVASALPHAAAAALWAQDITVALDTADRLPQGLVSLNSLDLLDPSTGGTDLDEALREFGCPPWEQPPEVEEPLSPSVTLDDPGDPELAQAVATARGAASGWGRLPGASRARVLRGAAAALPGGPGTPEDGDRSDTGGSLRGALLRWAERAERAGGTVQEMPGGRALLTRPPLGVLGVAWGWPRLLALELLLPALALGNAVVVVAPSGGAGAAQRLRKALVAAGLPAGALTVLPGASRGSGSRLARQRPDGLWLCGGDAVPPLLLLLALPALGSCCSFGFNPISSTFSAHLNNLTPWLLLDYPVAMPSNLELRMLGVAGKDLAPLLRTLLAQLHFVTECHIQDPQGCVQLERVNVSQLLETLAQHLGGLQGRPLHFPGCAHLRCRPDPALSSPAERHERHKGTLGARQGPPSPTGHGLLLLGGLGGALGLVAAAWALWRKPCAQVGILGGTGEGGESVRGAVCVGDTGDTGDAGCPGDAGSTGGSLGVTGSTGKHWEVIPLSTPQPSQGPPRLEQDGT